MQQLAGTLIKAGITPRTQQSYSRVWVALAQFCTSQGHPEWAHPPLQPYVVMLFLASKFAEGVSGATLASYSSALAYVHKLMLFEDPTNSFAVHKLIKGAQRLVPVVDVRLPISRHILSQLISVLPLTAGSRFASALLAALFSVAFHGFFRLGELLPQKPADSVRVVQFQDLFLEGGKNPTLTLNLRHSKTAKGSILVSLKSTSDTYICPVSLTSVFITLRGDHPGPLFSYPNGIPVLRHWFSVKFNSALNFLGLNPKRFKGHSFRIGAATEAAAQGLSDAQIRARGRWNSDAFKRYIRLQ